MNTPITYYGGKQKLAERIISKIPEHKIYVEPYFGGGAVFFKKNKSYLEVINDNNEFLINFYYVSQNNYPELKQLIDLSLHSESLFHFAKDIYNSRIESTEIEKAWSIWYLTNFSFNGSMHGGWKWSNGRSGSHEGIYVENKKNNFSIAVNERLKNVSISCRDALTVIKNRDTEDTFFYIDPPYPGSCQQHYRGFTHKDLYDLLDVLSKIKGKFILSNYWSQTLKYFIIKNGWNFEKIKTSTACQNLNKRVYSSRVEILVQNFNNNPNLFEQIGQ